MRLIAGNWKMNPETLDQAEALATAVRDGAAGPARLVICPPFTALAAVARILAGSHVAVGAQDCHAARAGAHTGDISAPMLRDLGATFVILGHSERRAAHGETDAAIRQKVEAAMAAGLIPIVCVGETEAERAAGRAVATVSRQVRDSLPGAFQGVVAYEPVWAIGAGRTPNEQEVAEIHAHLRAELAARHPAPVPILYGGSVKAANAAALLRLPEVGGALVGGASLVAAEFLAIAGA